ncbi:F-box/kelch-repeat protein-like [Dorcoceras hygrometricum]|uniref:F-box/kelch-repeat protein-like n=1 Tax=Dorcoceras hygrometricum TaxID=472368 RepID=A0A2Z7B390_9LAMI|nr:F-box/kelch-repeat protein-like [Dorcoceras hygrometricum]
MSLFDLQDVCIVIGSLATLDLPMVVDLIGIYVLKGPYCTLTMTDWFLQELSVIPRGSWGDVSRHFTMIRWPIISLLILDLELHGRHLHHTQTLLAATPHLHSPSRPPPSRAAAVCRRLRGWTRSNHRDEEIPFVVNSSALLMQTDEGVVFPVVDRIRRTTAANR